MTLSRNKAGCARDKAEHAHDNVMRTTGLSTHDSDACATKVLSRDRDFYVATDLVTKKKKKNLWDSGVTACRDVRRLCCDIKTV